MKNSNEQELINAKKRLNESPYTQLMLQYNSATCPTCGFKNNIVCSDSFHLVN